MSKSKKRSAEWGYKSTLKEISSQTDQYLVSLYSKAYVFENKMTKY